MGAMFPGPEAAVNAAQRDLVAREFEPRIVITQRGQHRTHSNPLALGTAPMVFGTGSFIGIVPRFIGDV